MDKLDTGSTKETQETDKTVGTKQNTQKRLLPTTRNKGKHVRIQVALFYSNIYMYMYIIIVLLGLKISAMPLWNYVDYIFIIPPMA